MSFIIRFKRFIPGAILVAMLLCLCGALNAEQTVSPTRAAIYSAVLPGGGQIYNQAYYKAGVVIGLQGYLLANAFYNDHKADDYKALSAQASDTYSAELYRQSRKEYQQKRNSDIWWMGITMGLSVLDAWVDANLHDFDAQKNKVHLNFEDNKLQLEYRF